MKCKKCNLKGAYVRLKTQEIVCNQCGATYPVTQGEFITANNRNGKKP